MRHVPPGLPVLEYALGMRRRLCMTALSLALSGLGCNDRSLIRSWSCGGNTCPVDSSCDEERARCVAAGDPCETEGRAIPCLPGETACSLGCRMCTIGAWTDCRAQATGDACQPGALGCDDRGLLVVCDDVGIVFAAFACGLPGCNSEVTPNRCNECVPDTTSCSGLLLVECGADGLVKSRRDCETDSRCVDAGVCRAATGGCEVVARAPAGTPCDEGSGQNGNFCDSVCDGMGNCDEAPVAVSCDDANDCTGRDHCAPQIGCVNSSLPPGTVCGELCNTACDGAGQCRGEGIDCDDGNPCTADICTPGVGCGHELRSGTCDDGDSCTTVDTCIDGLCTGIAFDPCSDGDPCTEDICISGTGCQNPAVDCSGTGGNCRTDRQCDAGGAPGNCDILASPINEGQPCDDCLGGNCTVCDGGVCADFPTCDGTVASPACFSAVDCVGAPLCEATACTTVACVNDFPEHQACSDMESGAAWGQGMPCQAVLCTDDAQDGAEAIGQDCFSQTDNHTDTVTITYELNTASPTGTLFNLWMRNALDSSLDAGEQYDCTLSGVTGLVGPLTFGFTETGLRRGRHGPGCPGFGSSNGVYCWMAVDGDTDPQTYDAIPLDQGEHLLSCTITFSSGDRFEAAGFDGIIFTADLRFIPDEAAGPAACGDSDQAFSDGACAGTNWGPNLAPGSGHCAEGTPYRGREVCDDCLAGAGNCSVCRAGVCQSAGQCNGVESCFDVGDCTALAGLCTEVADDCDNTACVGAVHEHQACSDVVVGSTGGGDQPCRALRCTDDGAAGATAIGGDCFSVTDNNRKTVRIVYELTTNSPSGTGFNIWLRHAVDADLESWEYSTCTLTGVTDHPGTVPFSFTHSHLRSGRFGPGCTGFDSTNGAYCWLAMDGDTDPATFDPIHLDRGLHTLTCAISFVDTAADESGGFDGLIFTSDTAFIPDESDGPAACGDSDQTFGEGGCVGLNWGPNSGSPVPGACSIVLAQDGSACAQGAASNDTCCSGVCIAGAPTGSCP